MHCSASLGILPIVPRLPPTLAVLLILSLLGQLGGIVPVCPRLTLPVLTIPTGRWHSLRRRTRRVPWFACCSGKLWPFWRNGVPALLGRTLLLTLLLHTSGWVERLPWSGSVLLLPLLQMLHLTWRLTRLAPASPSWARGGSLPLQRAYQLALVLLLLSSLWQLGSRLLSAPSGWLCPLALGLWVTHPDNETEIRITAQDATHYEVLLRGAFTLVWESHDGFEKWLLVLFLRHFQRVGQTRPVLSQAQLAEAFDTHPTYVSRWETEVRQHGWHVLSDRFRRTLQSVLPDAERSRAILQVWVPAFWLSAWEVRERLLQLGVIPNREALDVEALYAVAKHTGFNLVRELLLERFDLQGGQLITREQWWLAKLLALNERLLDQLERGERLTRQALIEIEPLRLPSPEKQGDGEENGPPLAAAFQSVLFAPVPLPSSEGPTSIRCTYCGSDQVAPKSKQPRRKTVLDEHGVPQTLPVVRYYCHNPACRYGSFTYFPPGVLPHSRYALPLRLVAVEVYETLLTTYRRSARMFGVKAATIYHWIVSLSPAATCLAAYLGVVRTSGVVGIDDKWILVCSPSAVRPHGRRARSVWRYVYFAIDVYSYDLLALELYPAHNEEAVRLILLNLKAKGIRPRVVVSDLDPAYGRILPQIFPNAIHHECIFHALQNASRQMTKVYGRYYLEKVPESVPLHDALTQLFNAQTQKTVRQRFADLMALREASVRKTPEIACVFDSLEAHFPKLVNAIESADIPRTNNATELVIRRFDQHYQAMCGLDTLESAKIYLRVFELVYRLTPFTDDGRPAIRGKSPLELAGYDLKALPIANFFMNLKLPALALQDVESVPMP